MRRSSFPVRSAGNGRQTKRITAQFVACRRAADGFSLVEALMALAVLAVLATATVPAYSDYVRRAHLPEAFSNLAAYRLGMEHYFQDHQIYGSGNGSCADDDAVAGSWNRFSPAGEQLFDYQCTALPAQQGYLITATGRAGTSVNGHVFSIDQDGVHRTTRFRGAPMHAECWLTIDTNC